MVLEKYHGLGNDYLVFDPQRNAGEPELTPARARLICDRNYGAGSDGILVGPLFAGLHDGGCGSDIAGGSGGSGGSDGFGCAHGKPGVRIINPDGSEAEKSGNGVRIFAAYLRDFGYVDGAPFTLGTLGGDVAVEFLKAADGGVQGGACGGVPGGVQCNGDKVVRVDMGRATFWSDEIPVSGARREVVDEPMDFGGSTYRATCVSVGNPHCVIMAGQADIPTKERALALGPLVERSPMFPNRINMQLACVLSRSEMRIEIFERGAGYTLASGTSACAAACAAFRLGFVDAEVAVLMPGGALRIEIDGGWQVRMTGAVSRVCAITFAGSFMEELWRR